MRSTILLIICFISFGLSANSIENYIKHSPQNDSCECVFDSPDFSVNILTNAIQKGIENPHFLACTYHCLGVFHYKKQNDFQAIAAYKTALKIRKEHKNPLTAKSYYNLGLAYQEVNYPKKAISSLSAAMDLEEKYQKKLTANIYLSQAYREIGEYQKALEYAHIALNIGQSEKDKGRAHDNLATIHKRINTPENLMHAVKHATEAIRLFNEAQKKFHAARAYNNLANILELLQQYDESISNYQKALKIYTKDHSLHYARILNNIALVFNKQNKYNEALKLLNESLALKQNYHDRASYHPIYFYDYENLGDSYTGLGNYKTAIQNYDKALDNLKDDPNAENPYIYNKPDYIRILDLKAQAAKMNGDIKLAHQIYLHIDDWITTFYKDLSTNSSKLTWIERAHTIYGNAIEVALMKGDEEKAFQYAEKAHAVLLWQNLSQDAAVGLLDEKDQEKREDLIAKLRQAERQYQNGSIDISTLRALEKAQEKFEAELENDHPEYARSKYQPESTTVAQVQDMIDENTAFIEYFWTNDVLRIFIITKKGITVHTENAEGLAEQITELRSIISQPKCYANCAKNTYNPLAFNLYKKLIPNEIQTNLGINRLIIVADKAIGTLPFSSLVTEASGQDFYPEYPFLLQKYATNYLYSAGSFLQLQQKTTEPTAGFAGFAPVEYDIADRDFLPLYRAEEEVEKIAEMYPSRQRKTYTNAAATKQNFIDALQQNYHTVLLATHAQYKNQNGEIIFQNEVMDQNEIDQLSHINIQRLILSACQTAEGKQNAGEGVLSLGWNFAYKGVPSITMNQWSVSEKATMQIMFAYNEALLEGVPADQALKHAQINYLNGDDISLKKYYQPYYWAAIVHAGNPLDTKTDIYTYRINDNISDEHLWWVLIALMLTLAWRVLTQRE